jgi:thymidine phosphorylase
MEDTIDPAVGLYLAKKIGDRVKRGDVLCKIHWNDKRRLRDALPLVEQAFEVKSKVGRIRPLIHAVMEG